MPELATKPPLGLGGSLLVLVLHCRQMVIRLVLICSSDQQSSAYSSWLLRALGLNCIPRHPLLNAGVLFAHCFSLGGGRFFALLL